MRVKHWRARTLFPLLIGSMPNKCMHGAYNKNMALFAGRLTGFWPALLSSQSSACQPICKRRRLHGGWLGYFLHHSSKDKYRTHNFLLPLSHISQTETLLSEKLLILLSHNNLKCRLMSQVASI